MKRCVCGAELKNGMIGFCSRPCRQAYKAKKTENKPALNSPTSKKQKNAYLVYVDGSSNRFESIACVEYNGMKTVERYPPYEDSNLMEQRAILMALEMFNDKKSVRIVSDSKSSVKAFKPIVNDRGVKLVWNPREYNKAGIYLDERLSLHKEGRIYILE